MESWDDKMQNECAISFQREEVISKMTLGNLQRLMEIALTIILNFNIDNEEVISSFLMYPYSFSISGSRYSSSW